MVWTSDLSDANSSREKRRLERTLKLTRPSPSGEVAVYGGGKARPIEGSKSHKKVTTKPGFLEAVKKRFDEIGGQFKT